MANIVASVLSFAVQVGGRLQVHEIHTDLVGVTHTLDYLADANADINAALAAHAADTSDALQNAEISGNVNGVTSLGSLATPTFTYSTQAQNLAALRAAYRAATRTDAVMIGDFLSSLTNAQLQTIFSMTSGQVTTLRANFLTPAASAAATIRAAVGS